MVDYKAMTVDFITFTKEIQDITEEINQKLHDKAFKDDKYTHRYIFFDYPCFIGDNKIKLEVNWSAIGNTTPEKTKAFAEALMEAAQIAESYHYNNFRVTF